MKNFCCEDVAHVGREDDPGSTRQTYQLSHFLPRKRASTYLGIIQQNISVSRSLCPMFANPEKISLFTKPLINQHNRLSLPVSCITHNTTLSYSQSSRSMQTRLNTPHLPIPPAVLSSLPVHISTTHTNSLNIPPSLQHSNSPAQP